MSADESHLGESVGADTAASIEERNQTDDLIEALDDLPQLTEREFRRRHEPRQHDGVFADEWNDEYHKMQYQPLRADLPGFGSERPDCGVEIPHVCKDCGHRIDIGRTCAQSRCPRCAPAWVMRRAPSIVARILSSAKMKEGSQKFHHVTVDPPTGLVDADDPVDEMIDRLQEFCRRINFDGAIFFHPWRGSEEEPGDDRGEWKRRLFNGREWEGDVREELRFSPHFHLIGSCEWVPGGDQTKRIWEETGAKNEKGWLINRVTPRGSSRSITGVDGLARAVAYSLSHVGIDTRGEQDRYVHGKVGSAFHNAGGFHHDQNVATAEAAVRKVAPDVLGLPSTKIECRAEVPEDEAGADREHDHDADGDGSGDDAEPEADSETGTAPCRSGLTEVDEADWIEDPDWQQQALHADEAITALEEWRDAGGWQGWKARTTGQSTLPDPGSG